MTGNWTHYLCFRVFRLDAFDDLSGFNTLGGTGGVGVSSRFVRGYGIGLTANEESECHSAKDASSVKYIKHNEFTKFKNAPVDLFHKELFLLGFARS